MEQINKIIEKANECLNCKKPMCKKGCPISTDVPSFISCIKDNNYKEAYNILHENNLMSEICCTVCPVENQCMGSCVKGIKGKPVEINYLEKFINDWASENNIKYELKIDNTTNKKVAIVGSRTSRDCMCSRAKKSRSRCYYI